MLRLSPLPPRPANPQNCLRADAALLAATLASASLPRLSHTSYLDLLRAAVQLDSHARAIVDLTEPVAEVAGAPAACDLAAGFTLLPQAREHLETVERLLEADKANISYAALCALRGLTLGLHVALTELEDQAAEREAAARRRLPRAKTALRHRVRSLRGRVASFSRRAAAAWCA